MLKNISYLMTAANDPAAGEAAKAGAAAAAAIKAQAPQEDPEIKRLQEQWQGKEYAAIAAHHTTLSEQGHVTEAAFFHKHVVMTFKPSKK